MGLCRREEAVQIICITALLNMHFWDEPFDLDGAGMGNIHPEAPGSADRQLTLTQAEGIAKSKVLGHNTLYVKNTVHKGRGHFA